jgi:hypothetical protein
MNWNIYCNMSIIHSIAFSASSSCSAAKFRLVLGCLISDAQHGCDFRASEIMNFILYNLERKEWTKNSRNAVQDVKEKKMSLLKPLFVGVLHSICSRIWVVTRNCFLYIRTYLDVYFHSELYNYFPHIHAINIFQIWLFLLYKNIRLFTYCRTIFLLFFFPLYYGPFLWIIFHEQLLPFWNK